MLNSNLKPINIDMKLETSSNGNCYTHLITLNLSNRISEDLFDISVFLFVDEKKISLFSQCIKVISSIPSLSEISFNYEYYSELIDPHFHIRIIYRKFNESTHSFSDFDFSLKDNNRSQPDNSFVSLIRIKHLSKIIDVFPITNGISYTNFGSVLGTYVNITYIDFSDNISNFELCGSTLIKGFDNITISNISYGNYCTFSFGNSLLLEIPIIINSSISNISKKSTIYS